MSLRGGLCQSNLLFMGYFNSKGDYHTATPALAVPGKNRATVRHYININKKSASLESTTGRRNRPRRSLMRISCLKKNPENKNRFRGMNPHRDHAVLSFTFFYPDYTVGPGIPPGHVLRLCSALVGFTTDRELHPAPKVIKL